MPDIENDDLCIAELWLIATGPDIGAVVGELRVRLGMSVTEAARVLKNTPVRIWESNRMSVERVANALQAAGAEIRIRSIVG